MTSPRLKDSFKTCYEALRKKLPNASGEVDAEFKIDASGRTESAKIDLRGLPEDTEYRDCLNKAVANVRYPAWATDSKRAAKVGYRMEFSPK